MLARRHLGRLQLRHFPRLGHEVEDQLVRGRDRGLELPRVVEGIEVAGLGAEAAVHAEADVDVELGHIPVPRHRVLARLDADAAQRADLLALQADRAAIHVDFEDAAVAFRQHLLHRLVDLVRVLHRRRPPEHIAHRHAQAIEGRGQGETDVPEVGPDGPPRSPAMRAHGRRYGGYHRSRPSIFL